MFLMLNLDPIYVFGPDQSAEQPGGMSAVYRAVEVDIFHSASFFFFFHQTTLNCKHTFKSRTMLFMSRGKQRIFSTRNQGMAQYMVWIHSVLCC